MDKYSPCPCDSKKSYSKCCCPYHLGTLPETALSLMRSRYSAYALGLADYIMATTHSTNAAYREDRQAWSRDLESHCRSTNFNGLKILQFEDGKTTATVLFTAYLRQGEQDATFTEKSAFVKENGRWLYKSGEMN